MSEQRVYVLRLGHRIERDKRVTMHILLTARALSASGVIYSGEQDRELEARIQDVVSRWGGLFKVKYEKKWKTVIENWRKKGIICHLTMYGTNINDCFDDIPKNKDVLIVIGSQKVPREIYKLVDYNIAIGNQPHSEVTALTIFLDRFFEGKELKKKFVDAKLKIVPQNRGKKVIS